MIESSQSELSAQEAGDAGRGNRRYDLDDRETPFIGSPARPTTLADQSSSMIMGSQLDPNIQAIRGMIPASSLLQAKPKVNKRDIKSIENWTLDS